MYPNMPKPAAETDAGQERLRAYYLALGEFADAFAWTELLMHFVLRWHTKTTALVSRAVFSGVRTDQTTGYLRRLAEAGLIEPAEWADLLPVIEQLKLINDCRNAILHHGAADVALGRGYVSNQALALTIGRIKSFPISPEILGDMTSDLRKINAHFLTRHMGRSELRGEHSDLDAVLAASWRYKPPSQQKLRNKTAAKSQPPRKRDPKQPLPP
jgi:hypothetical protein